MRRNKWSWLSNYFFVSTSYMLEDTSNIPWWSWMPIFIYEQKFRYSINNWFFFKFWSRFDNIAKAFLCR